MNYGELKTMLEGYLHRSDLTSMIPNFVILAQARLNHDIRHIMLNTTASIKAVTTTPNITLPTGFLQMKRLRVPYSGGYRTLKQQTLEQNEATNEARGWASGVPECYAIINDTTAELVPTPEENVTLTSVYRKKLTMFSTDGITDLVLTAFPNAYVYACMLEATPFINSDKRVGLWKSLYDEEIIRIEDINYEAQWSDSPRSISNPAADTP